MKKLFFKAFAASVLTATLLAISDGITIKEWFHLVVCVCPFCAMFGVAFSRIK